MIRPLYGARKLKCFFYLYVIGLLLRSFCFAGSEWSARYRRFDQLQDCALASLKKLNRKMDVPLTEKAKNRLLDIILKNSKKYEYLWLENEETPGDQEGLGRIIDNNTSGRPINAVVRRRLLKIFDGGVPGLASYLMVEGQRVPPEFFSNLEEFFQVFSNLLNLSGWDDVLAMNAYRDYFKISLDNVPASVKSHPQFLRWMIRLGLLRHDQSILEIDDVFGGRFFQKFRSLKITDQILVLGSPQNNPWRELYGMIPSNENDRKFSQPNQLPRILQIGSSSQKEASNAIFQNRLYKYLGSSLGQIEQSQLGHNKIIVDIYGDLSKTNNLERDLDRLLNALEVGGELFVLTQGARVRVGPREYSLGAYLELVPGLSILMMRGGRLEIPEAFVVTKTNLFQGIPPLRELEFIPGVFPIRVFEQISNATPAKGSLTSKPKPGNP